MPCCARGEKGSNDLDLGNADLEGVQLAKIGVLEVGARTSLSFRVE
jgi:hypothetical protein